VVSGARQTSFKQDGSLERLDLQRGVAAFPVDKGLYCDPLLTRHKKVVLDHLRKFKPDLIHITGPGDIGFLGLWAAHILRILLVSSWHTNLHEYLSRRLSWLMNLLPRELNAAASAAVEKQSLRGLLRFYRTARFVLAPNQTLVELLHNRTGKPAFLMPHGLDLTRFSPRKDRKGDQRFCIGYVGRLTAEKNVRCFHELETRLRAAGETDYKFLIVGDGGQQEWLRKHLRNAELPGVLTGEALAAAYGCMDAFVFPSRTDTFGLVLLEALASGIPVIASPETAGRVGIEDAVSGFLSDDFAVSVRTLMHDRALLLEMSRAARQLAGRNSWDVVFEQLYRTYEAGLILTQRKREEIVTLS
jgi:glycosyltransferase involved in cell wall biosynthesis